MLKKMLSAIVVSVMMVLMSFSATAAIPALGGAIWIGLVSGHAYQAGQRDAQGLPGACYNEPDHLVKWKDAPGYSFAMGGCDYVAKKDLVTTLN